MTAQEWIEKIKDAIRRDKAGVSRPDGETPLTDLACDIESLPAESSDAAAAIDAVGTLSASRDDDVLWEGLSYLSTHFPIAYWDPLRLVFRGAVTGNDRLKGRSLAYALQAFTNLKGRLVPKDLDEIRDDLGSDVIVWLNALIATGDCPRVREAAADALRTGRLRAATLIVHLDRWYQLWSKPEVFREMIASFSVAAVNSSDRDRFEAWLTRRGFSSKPVRPREAKAIIDESRSFFDTLDHEYSAPNKRNGSEYLQRWHQ